VHNIHWSNHVHEPILLVEDDPVIQLSLTTILRRDGYTIDTARNLAEARQLIASRRPRVILLDLGLPDGSGFELLKWLTTEPDRPLIIVTTANDTPQSILHAITLGAFDYLTKPINNDILRHTIQRALNYDRLRQQARNYEELQSEVQQTRQVFRDMAHHISQVLTVIMGEAQLVHAEITDPTLRESLNRIVRMAEDAAQTLSALRALRLLGAQESNSELSYE
jgi:DNA-binding NtrC family response regulator